MSPRARAALTRRARRGSRNNCASDVPVTSHVAQITTIIAVSTEILAAASIIASSARRPLAKTAAIATQAFGLATPRSAPPASEGASETAVCSESGGAPPPRLERPGGRRWASIGFGRGARGAERPEVSPAPRASEPPRHDVYAIGITTAGVQTFRYRGERRVCLPGQLHILHPDETHDGAAGTEDGFGYRILYIAPELVRDALSGRPLPFVADPVQELIPTARSVASLLADIDEVITELSCAEIAAAVADLLLTLSGRADLRRATIDIKAVELVRDYLAAHASEH